ncbi:MAG: TetR/AcrR family transcriptional regulator [Chloroflexota bacterium]
MAERPQNATRDQILDVAESLFSSKGYGAVKLRDIGDAVGMRHASLYYYVPGGKEELYLEVMQRNFKRHHAGMTQAIEDAGDDIRQQVHGVAQWLISQPPINLSRMQQADLPALQPQNSQMLGDLAIYSLSTPLIEALKKANSAGTINIDAPEVAAMALVTLMQSIHHIPKEVLPNGLAPFGKSLADMLLYGWLAR